MSRLAKKPIQLAAGVTAEIKDKEIIISSSKGKLSVVIPKTVTVENQEGGFLVRAADSSKQARADSGTVASLIKGSIVGVTQGFSKTLEIEGVGYKFAIEGDSVVLSLGYVLPVKLKIPAGISAQVEKSSLKISGIDKQSVGQFAAEIRSKKKPEPYKGKGIRYAGEIIRRKVGKKAATAS